MSSRQQSLFDIKPDPWELDDQSQQLVAKVVFPDGPSGEFDYLVPPAFRDASRQQTFLEAGRRVRVPLGRSDRPAIGYCVTVEYKPIAGRQLKCIVAVLDQRPLLSPLMLRLTRWMADYYLCGWGQALEAVVPAGVRQQAGTREMTLLSVPTGVAARITQLKLPAKQAKALQLLAASTKPLTPPQLAARAGCTLAPIHALRKKELVTEHADRIATAQPWPAEETIARQAPHALNDDQRRALDCVHRALHSQRHETILIHGVTGSGKTEVYIQAIEEVVRFGRQAIVLVPEISLTPQTVARFRMRFDRVAILHSHQSDGERHRYWKQIASGQVQVVVGARSAVFAPVPQLGLIILDEEHETTFKQEIAPRYHAREVARWRAREQQVPLILGSATPSLESWQRTVEGTYGLVQMPRRVLARPMPAVSTVDLRSHEHAKGSRGAISRPLHQAIEEALRTGGQAILLLNRRGYSTHIQCPACGQAVTCPNCDLSLTFHRQHNSAMCHSCDYQMAAPTACPACGSIRIRFSGFGTQKLEAEVRARFPAHPCVRMDTDSMRRPGSHENALSAFRAGEAKILLGTQMIAKGLDFPNVTLVGVINADMALHLPDFRAAERTFQLVAQVAGRTGRGAKGGRVLVQTFSPQHPAIRAATRHDYSALAACELPLRSAAGYPPFASMVRIIVRGEVESAASATAGQIADRLRALASNSPATVRIRGPAVAPMAKLRGNYRFHIQLQSVDADAVRTTVQQATSGLKLPKKVACAVDVDPLDMM